MSNVPYAAALRFDGFKIMLNDNLAIFAKVFPNTWAAYLSLEWEYDNVRDFLKSWLVDEWQELHPREFELLSTVELLTVHEWKIFGICRGCHTMENVNTRTPSGLWQCDECDLAR